MVVISSDGKTNLNQRTGKGIWQNLYEFPLIQSDDRLDERAVLKHHFFKELFSNNKLILKRFNSTDKVHKLSHQHLFVTFWIVNIEGNLAKGINWKEVENFPVPILIHNFVEELKRTEFVEESV